MTPLSKEEEANVLAALNAMTPFPGNPFSGCHSRAELVFRNVDAPAQRKAFKVWLFSGYTMAPALSGSIHHSTPSGVETSWLYHVAAAYVAPDGAVKVIDPAVGKLPVDVDRWTEGFRYDGVAVMTYLPGEWYLSNLTEVPASQPKDFPDGMRVGNMTRNVVNGNFFRYDDRGANNQPSSHDNHRGAIDLALDAVAEELLAGKLASCSLRGLASNSKKLEAALLATPATAGCEEAVKTLRRETERWSSRGL